MARRRRPNYATSQIMMLLIVGGFVIFAIPVLAVVAPIALIIYAIANAGKVKIQRNVNAFDELCKIDMMSGEEFERYTAQLLKQSGYSSVEVTKASGDYGADVIAYKNGEKAIFQCKCYARTVGLKPIQEVHAAKQYYKASRTIVVTNNYFSANAKELASVVGVELWNREVLEDLILAIR